MIYIGQDSHNNPNYYGSGVRYLNAENHYRKQNFKKEIIEYCTSKEDMDNAEIFWIQHYDATNPEIGYNLAEGGGGSLGIKPSKETRQKISKNKKKYFETHEIWNKGKTHLVSNATRQKISKTMMGHLVSNAMRQKISKTMMRHLVSNATRQKISKSNMKYHILKEDLIQKYLIEGKTQYQIAEGYGCCQITISRNLKKYNIKKY